MNLKNLFDIFRHFLKKIYIFKKISLNNLKKSISSYELSLLS